MPHRPAHIFSSAVVALAMAALAASAATAQDPYASAYESMSQQQFVTQQSRINGMALNKSSRRYHARRPTGDQVRACAQRPRFRAELGAAHPKVRKLNQLCRGVGL